MLIVAGTLDASTEIRAMTNTGALNGKVAADFDVWYRRDAGKVPIVLSDLTALTDPHSDGGIKEIGDGWYRVDLPDPAVAVGSNRVAVGGSVDGGTVVSAPIALSVGGAGGVFTQTVTVTDGTNPIQGATVDILSGTILVDSKTTNALGIATPSCNAGTYTLRVTMIPLYASDSQEIVVAAAGTHDVELSIISLLIPTDPLLCLGVLRLIDEDGSIDIGGTASLVIVSGPGNDGYSYDTTPWVKTANGNGDCVFGSATTGLVRGATYNIYRGISTRIFATFVCPVDEDSFSINEVLGKD